MARRRTHRLELNFDSMTDLITNLAGGLILLVLLLIGVTRDAASQTKEAPPPPPAPEEGAPEAGERSMGTLLQRVNLLRAEVKAVDETIRGLEDPLRRAQEEVEELLKKVDAVQPPAPEEEKPREPAPKTVEFRPPMSRRVSKSANIAFVCEQGRVSVLDFDALNAAVGPVLRDFATIRDQRIPVGAGDFDIQLRVVSKTATTASLSLEAVRKAGPAHAGETAEQIRASGSTFQGQLQRFNPAESALQFCVYHDSFDVFRAARQVSWDRNFDLGWVPFPSGQPVRVGGGGGGVGIQ